MKGHNEIISALPTQCRAKIEERAAVLIAEQFVRRAAEHEAALLLKEAALRDLEDASALTVERIAELLGVGEVDDTRPEGEADISLFQAAR